MEERENFAASLNDDGFALGGSLTSIEIPSGVTSIGDQAFEQCYSLTSIKIPSSVTSIGDQAFMNCLYLIIYCEAESAPSGWGRYWNSGCPVVWDCKNNEVAEDGNIYATIDKVRYALGRGKATVIKQNSSDVSEKTVIPSSVVYGGKEYSVTSIGERAFSSTGLTSIEIPSGVTGIGKYAFNNCRSLTNIEIPSGVMSIGDSAFEECIELKSITIPGSVTEIGKNAFKRCLKLTSIAREG